MTVLLFPAACLLYGVAVIGWAMCLPALFVSSLLCGNTR